jgi:hypothetical protein
MKEISKEDSKNPIGIIKFLLSEYPEDLNQLNNLFQSLDEGHGANIENMENEKTKKLMKSLFKQLGLEKKKTNTGDKVYVKVSDEICLFEILKKMNLNVSLKTTSMTFEEAEKIIETQNKPESLLEIHQRKKNIETQPTSNRLKNFMEKNNLKSRFQE